MTRAEFSFLENAKNLPTFSVSRKSLLAKAFEAGVVIFSTIGISVLATRFMSPNELGRFFLVSTWIEIILALSASASLSMVLTRELTQKPERRVHLFTSAIGLQGVIAVVLICLCIFSVPSFAIFSGIRTEILSGILLALCATPFALFQALLLSKNRVGSVAICNSLAQILGFLFLLSAILSQSPLWVKALCMVLPMVFGPLLIWRVLGSVNYLGPKAFNISDLKILASQTLPILLMSLATHLYVRIDTLMIERMLSRESVGVYAATYRLLDCLMILSNFLMLAFYPSLSQAVTQNIEVFHSLFRKSLILLIWTLFPIALLFCVFSNQLGTLILGHGNSEANAIISWLMLAGMLAWLNGASGSVLIALRKQQLYMIGTVLSLVLNVLVNLLLIPKFGAPGAAMATALTELCILSFSWYVIYKVSGYLPFFVRQKTA